MRLGVPATLPLQIQENTMEASDSTIAVFSDHDAAEKAVRSLMDAGFDKSKLSVVGKGVHTEEKVIGFYNAGDRILFEGSQGAIWGGFWGLFLGALLVPIPAIGPVLAFGYLGAALTVAAESAVVVGGVSALTAALYSIGIPKNSVVQYETMLKSNGFMVMVHGSPDDTARARAILAVASPSSVDTYPVSGTQGANNRDSAIV
jgi:hypothetical protein